MHRLCTQTEKKTTNVERSQPTEGVQNNTDTERSIKQNEKESENRQQREQPLWTMMTRGKWETCMGHGKAL